MFGKRCSNCNSKIKDDFNFCPSCSKNLKSYHDKEDYGLLGKNDFDDFDLSDNFIDKLFNSAMKMFERQMKNMPNGINNNLPKLNVQFFVDGERIFPEKSNPNPIKINNSFSKENLERLLKLPKKEPVSRLKRLSGKIICEIFVPGVKTIEDVMINQLENSIEIKAISDDKIYSKNLKINLPIMKCHLINGSLIIEMKAG